MPERSRSTRIAAVTGVALAVAALTAVIFLIRAGDPGATNWPIDFELRSSDNGVLFQFAQDVFTGRALDWSFSPQVFVFPEIPISLFGYLIAGGSVQGYYLVVACANNALLFVALFALVSCLFRADALGVRLARAAIAGLPLLLLPLLGTTWLLEYTLAPTYYFGMYLVIIVAPTLFLARRRWVRIAVGVGIALAGASNPLTFVFIVPAFACVVLLRGFAIGWRSILQPLAWSSGIVLLALVVRLVFFGRLQGGSPFAYMDPAIFAGRLRVLPGYFEGLFADPTTATVITIGALSALAGLAVAIVLAARAGARRVASNRAQVAIYLALVPVTGLLGTLILIITDYLYFWPVLIAPLVFGLLAVPRGWVRWALPASAAVLVVTGLATGAASNLQNATAYFSYRSPQTQCLDSNLPPGVRVGYATFSDARQLELTSALPFRLIQLKSSGVRAYWLTNRDYARDSVGRFFYIDDEGDEPPISTAYIEAHFGMPDRQFSCGPGTTVLIYDQPAKLAKIKARYSTLPAP